VVAVLLGATRVLAGDGQGVIHLLRLDDGELVSRVDLGKPVAGAPLRSDQTALLQTQGGALHAVSLE
jgi:hypothetical protein